jgi:hypothetical protein
MSENGPSDGRIHTQSSRLRAYRGTMRTSRVKKEKMYKEALLGGENVRVRNR